mmetsp:Transcript_15274/g.42321  ORF Transcript_15274/g.42321 Transcript_15274/m.42321 type:complete len:127 (+) Transcript_15274:671-1051(+)
MSAVRPFPWWPRPFTIASNEDTENPANATIIDCEKEIPVCCGRGWLAKDDNHQTRHDNARIKLPGLDQNEQASKRSWMASIFIYTQQRTGGHGLWTIRANDTSICLICHMIIISVDPLGAVCTTFV